MKAATHFVQAGQVPSVRRQRGVTLVIALLVLVAMTLAGLALVRSVDSATLLAGNLAFRQSTAASAELGLESALAALRTLFVTPTNLNTNGAPGSGYFAQVPWNASATPPGPADVDFTGNATPTTTADDFDWTTATQVTGADAAGNDAFYVIHRLCQNTGALDAATCTIWQEQGDVAHGTGALTAGEDYNPDVATAKPPPMRGLYRVTVRIAGPRNTFSYAQTIVIL